MPEAVARLRAQPLHGVDDAFDRPAVAFAVVGTGLDQRLVAMDFSPTTQIGLVNTTQRPDDSDREFPHPDFYGHRSKRPRKSQVHHCRTQDVVAVMTEGDFRTTQFLRCLKELFPPVP